MPEHSENLIQEINQKEASQFTNDSSEFSGVVREEAEKTKSLVELKKTKNGYVLNVHCKSLEASRHFFSKDLTAIKQLCQNFVMTMREKGNPLLDNGMSKKELQEFASQLGKPEGERGIEVGYMMNKSNIPMIRKTLEHVSIKHNEHLLELGHGNANHLAELFGLADHLQYDGLDISEIMKRESEKYCRDNQLDKSAKFHLYDGVQIPFPDNRFDKIFTVNTIYFWQKPDELLNELHRVLKSDGTLCIAFVDEETMNQLPFTEFGFKKYSQLSFKNLIDKSKFKIAEMHPYSEMVKVNKQEEMERKFWVMVLKKAAGEK